jgi:methylated-DNA-[protein]-cysteine S-methyltransferase
VIYYSTLDHDITGRLEIFYGPMGLVSISFGLHAVVPGTARPVSPDDPAFSIYRTQLLEYLNGKRRLFTFDVDLSLLRSGFQKKVLTAAFAIPYGHVATYAQLAAVVGNPAAYRAVGNALASNPLPIVIPCHRVVATGGGLGGFMRNKKGGSEIKRRLLNLEGLEIQAKASTKGGMLKGDGKRHFSLT